MSAGNATASIARARAAIELDRWDVAADEARRAIAAEPTRAEAHGLLAQALHGKGDKKAALTTLEGALKLAPDDEWLHRLRGSFLIDTKPREALAAANEAVRLSPDNAWGHGLRARCLDKLVERAEARRAIQRALELAPHSGWLHRTRGDIELHVGFPNEAERGYREALKRDPHDAIALNNLGVALQRQQRHDEAALAFKAAVLADPTLAVAKQNTHSAVKNMTGAVAAGAGIGGIGIAKACAVGGSGIANTASHSSSNASELFGFMLAIVAIIAVISLVFFLVGRPLKKKRAEQRVKKLDPQLWTMYEQLERDKRSGRL